MTSRCAPGGPSGTSSSRHGPSRPRPTETTPSRAVTRSAEPYVAALAKPAVSLVPKVLTSAVTPSSKTWCAWASVSRSPPEPQTWISDRVPRPASAAARSM